MRIAFVSYYFPEYCIRHANAMAAEHDVLLVLPLDEESEALLPMIDDRVRCEWFERPRFRQPLRQWGVVRRLVRSIREHRPDVVHYQHGHLYFNLAALPGLRRYPLVVTVHDAQSHVGDRESRVTPQRVMNLGYRQADRVIVHGRSLVEQVTGERVAGGLGIDRERVHLVPHVLIGQDGVSEAAAAPEGRTSVEQQRDRVLFFGRIWEYKGLRHLIEAAPIVNAEFPDARFVIAGQGEDFQRYRDMMAAPDRFEVHNDWISDEQRAQFFREASVVALPYIEASQSGVIPIAYAHEKPVVATDVGGLPDSIDHGETGLIVPPRDPAALAEAILTLLRDPERRRRMGRAGREKIERECSPEVVAEQTLGVYRRVIADRRGGAAVAEEPSRLRATEQHVAEENTLAEPITSGVDA